MVNLPPVSEEFNADSSGYLAAIQAMIDQTEKLISTIGDAVAKVNELAAAIRLLPDEKTVTVNYVRRIVGDVPGDVTRTITDVNVGGGGTVVTPSMNITEMQAEAAALRETLANLQNQVNNLTGSTDDLTRADSNLDAVSEAVRAASVNLAKVMADESSSATRVANAISVLNTAVRNQQIASREAADATRRLQDQLENTASAIHLTDELHQAALAAITASNDFEDFGVRASEVASRTRQVDQAILEMQRDLQEIDAAERQAAAGAANFTGQEIDEFNALRQVRDALLQNIIVIGEQAGAVQRDSAAVNYFSLALTAAGGDAYAFLTAVENGSRVMLAMADAARQAGNNVGGITIPLGAAAFGITGLGTAIHLVIMGTFELLAVLIPAMYALAAAAAVMAPSVQNVKTQLQSMQTATSALGDMLNTTSGDVLGLGHSLKTAQDMAQPGVYELFGEAILGVNAAMGKLNNQGLSPFAQLGLDVTHMLDAFGAKLVVDIQDNITGVNKLLSNAITDLREFGQILGNVGHAMFNFASAMPGAAELALKMLDAFSQLIKWLSELPKPLLYAIMIIEELYRWSGLIAGAFGLMGRGIALLGTLGIPVLARIGMNFGAMVSNIILGVSGAITNFVALGTRIGVFGRTVDGIATGIVGVLGRVAAFMTSPWGAALALGGLAIAGLVIWLSHYHSATQQFVIDSQKAVQGASNLTALNIIGQQMSLTVNKAAQANQMLAQAQVHAGQTAQAAGGMIGGAAGRFNDLALAAGGAAGAVRAASGNVQLLTDYQKQLVQQNINVIQGAGYISKTYKVDFVTALGMADAAGVKLINNINDGSKAAQQAQIQIHAMFLGYAQMDQTGSILADTMGAINIQAGVQASKVGQVNQAWDHFIGMVTGLTGSFTQFNLDLQQMGNQATTVGGRIRAFTGTTQLAVSQIAQSLTSFSGSSAQTWQSFNQSVNQANTFMDNLRIAAAAGVVPQQQYAQGIASVVQQLQPYAQYSKAALSEVMALAQEANGPAYDASKSLAQNYQALASWTDKNALSSDKFSGMIDTLTQKLSNVTQVAKNFAGTLQQDVINAIAAAAINTQDITSKTQAYTKSLADNGAQNPKTQQAQDALTNTLKSYGLSAQGITQVEQILTSEYGKNQGQAKKTSDATNALGGVMDGARTGHVGPFASAIQGATGKLGGLAQEAGSHVPPALGATNSALDTARLSHLLPFQAMIQTTQGFVKTAEAQLALWPASESTKFNVSAGGGANISSSVPGVPGGRISVTGVASRFAGGGVLPGYSPGHDSVLAMLSPGEGVLTPQAVRMIGPGAVEHINKSAKHFAGGGLVFPDLPNFEHNYLSTMNTNIGKGFGQGLAVAVQKVAASTQQAMNAVTGGGYANPINVAGNANINSWIAQAIADTGVPASWAPDLLLIAMYESGFNPNAINLTDSNAARGDPSRGLMQTIMGTFNAFHQPGTSWNIYDPVANIAAAIRYIESRYGTVFNVPGILAVNHGMPYVGYDSGGWLMPGLTMAVNNTGRPEKVTPPGGGEGTMIHNVINLDGQTIWENQQQYTFRYNIRNQGRVSGTVSPQ